MYVEILWQTQLVCQYMTWLLDSCRCFESKVHLRRRSRKQYSMHNKTCQGCKAIKKAQRCTVRYRLNNFSSPSKKQDLLWGYFDRIWQHPWIISTSYWCLGCWLWCGVLSGIVPTCRPEVRWRQTACTTNEGRWSRWIRYSQFSPISRSSLHVAPLVADIGHRCLNPSNLLV